jgi:uncharacterized membrane protein
MQKKMLVHAVVAAMLGMGSAAVAHAASAPAMEKCYGIAKAGKNDCGTSGGSACAARSKRDKDPKEWIFVPKGVCEKIAGASLSAEQSE